MSNPFANGPATTKAKAKPGNDPFDAAGPDGTVVPSRKGGDPFSSPSSGSGDVRISDLVGELLLVKPTEYIESMMTSASVEPVDAVRADVVVLGADGTTELHEDMLVFQLALKRQLRRTLDEGTGKLLARLTMGDKKPGKNAPYIFVAAEEAEKDAARAYCAANPAW